MTMTGLPAPVNLVVGQANKFDTVASTEFLSSYFVITRKTKPTFVKTASIIATKSWRTESSLCQTLCNRNCKLKLHLPGGSELVQSTQRGHLVRSNSECQSTRYEATLRSVKGLSRCHLFKFHPPFWFWNWRQSVITCCVLIRKKIKIPTRNQKIK